MNLSRKKEMLIMKIQERRKRGALKNIKKSKSSKDSKNQSINIKNKRKGKERGKGLSHMKESTIGKNINIEIADLVLDKFIGKRKSQRNTEDTQTADLDVLWK